MEVTPITIYFKSGKKFTLNKDDWECAPDPICMELVDNTMFNKVAEKLERSVNDTYSREWDEDDYEDFLWSEYEQIVLDVCECFYYEDMTDDEYVYYETLKENNRYEFAKKVYNRIKEN